jgi:hypothetical protein
MPRWDALRAHSKTRTLLEFSLISAKNLFVKTFLKFVLSIIPFLFLFCLVVFWVMANLWASQITGTLFCPSKFNEKFYCIELNINSNLKIRTGEIFRGSCNLSVNGNDEEIKGILWIKLKLALLKFSFNNDIDIPSRNVNIFVWSNMKWERGS